jgi:hypothetical protein
MGKIKSFFNLKNIINVWAYPKWWAHPFLSCFIKKKKKNSGEHRARSFFSGELPSVSSSTIRPMYQTCLSSLYPRITIYEKLIFHVKFFLDFIKTNPPQAMRNAFHWLPPSCYLDFARIQCIDPSKSSSSKHVWIVVLASS